MKRFHVHVSVGDLEQRHSLLFDVVRADPAVTKLTTQNGCSRIRASTSPSLPAHRMGIKSSWPADR